MEGITKQQTDYIWQDREIRFDSKPMLLACRKGEKIIGTSKIAFYLPETFLMNCPT